jgi:glycyl-tRNA synthetase beta chain
VAEAKEFLLEVGFEEMPASWLPGLAKELKEEFQKWAMENQLYFEPPAPPAFFPDNLMQAVVRYTPRRLVLCSPLPNTQRAFEEKFWGPAEKAARDANGAWTKAAIGFAGKHGIKPEQLTVDVLKEGSEPRLVVSRPSPQEPTEVVLPRLTAILLRILSFRKRMSWDAWLPDGRGAFPFGRPIRWLVMLFGGKVVPFSIYELVDKGQGPVIVQSGDETRGHRFLPREIARGPIQVGSFDDLERKLLERFVILDPEERKKRITEDLERLTGGRPPADDHGLPAEWRDLVEYPTVVVGHVPTEFRSLPTEVLQTVLVHHQKYVPLVSGGSVDRFAAVINSDGTNMEPIVRGMERVVVARLRDAAFFYAEDRKRPLAGRLDDLAGVTFHQGLGSYRDKTERMVRLVDAMGADLGLLTKPEHEAAREAARLAKADLTTLMVREFPELQGVMGGIYLRAEGTHWDNVALAVQWHYHPVSVEEEAAPRGALSGGDATIFAAVSLADKLDTLAGYFGLGLAPTGSSDPFGLRRAAQGVVRLLLDFWVADLAERRPSLRRLAAQAVAGYAGLLKGDPAQTGRELEAFLLDRLRYVLVARGYPADEVEAALGAREPDALDDPHEAWLRLRALHRVRSEARDDFERLAVAFKRAKNILGEGDHGPADPALFQEPAEHELHQAVARLQAADGGYEARLRSLAGLRGPVDRFFDDVLVMAEDPRVRANRLGLLWPALSLFYRIADISKLAG